MHGFVRKLVTEWRRLELPFEGETLVVAVSGGADSVSLLLGLHELLTAGKLDHRLVGAHFNHGLRDGESDADERFVRELAVRYGIELAVGHGQVSREGNLEQNARHARYEFLEKTAANVKAYGVTTGHTINDQAETFLINLIRGSGPDGLSGIRPVRNMGQDSVLLIRPLLTWAKRGDTEAYCHDHSVEYRYDTMNEDTAFRRVRIRKVLLPLLQDFNPNIVETLADTAGLMQKLPRTQADENRFSDSGELIVGDVKLLPRHAVGDLIRAWLIARRGTARQLHLKHIAAVERLIFSDKSGRRVELPGGKVVKSGGKLVYEEN